MVGTCTADLAIGLILELPDISIPCKYKDCSAY